MDFVRRLQAQLDERNVDNVARTQSYLELYAWTRDNPPDLPWILMAHLVSRNAGYLMTDLARALDRTREPILAEGMTKLFVMLERANYLIFYDAWFHVCAHLLGESGALDTPRTPEFSTPEFVGAAYARYERARGDAREVDPQVERRLVLDLVHNEQHLIERRAVHAREFLPGLHLLQLIELFRRDRPIRLPWPAWVSPRPSIRVGKFAHIDRRIATGARIFDTALAERRTRDAMFQWALLHPHTGSRSDYGGRPGSTLRQVWPIERVLALHEGIHAEPEFDPDYP